MTSWLPDVPKVIRRNAYSLDSRDRGDVFIFPIRSKKDIITVRKDGMFVLKETTRNVYIVFSEMYRKDMAVKNLEKYTIRLTWNSGKELIPFSILDLMHEQVLTKKAK